LFRARGTITAAELAGSGETGFRADGRLHWVHCARTGKYTLLMVHPRRGRLAMEAMGILASFAGVAVHDAWAPYDTYTGPEHQLCCAHALRELQAVTDAAPAGQWCWRTQGRTREAFPSSYFRVAALNLITSNCRPETPPSRCPGRSGVSRVRMLLTRPGHSSVPDRTAGRPAGQVMTSPARKDSSPSIITPGSTHCYRTARSPELN
jgi:Transposase IS66 family